jgi:hypothetical protein
MLRRMLTAAAAAASVVALAAPPALASGALATTWRTVRLPVTNGVLNDLSALGPSDAWAAGADFLSGYVPILLRWNGRAWSGAPTRGIPADISLDGVDAHSDRDILADANETGGNLTDVVYRYNGTRWTSLPRPKAAAGGEAPYSASFGPGGQIWASGWTTGNRPAFWKLTPAGWRTYLTGVTASGYVSSPLFVTPDDAWSYGFTGLGSMTALKPLLLHFNGRQWSQVPAPAAAAHRGDGRA